MKLIESIISTLSPSWALTRAANRHLLQQIEGQRGDLIGSEINRNTRTFLPRPETGDIKDITQVQTLRNRSWHLYRNNPHAHKIITAINNRVIGEGLTPESQAEDLEGNALQDFRDRSKKLWDLWCENPSALGTSGRGGLDMTSIFHQVLRLVQLDGECFLRIIRISQKEMKVRNLPIPILLQVVDTSRVAEYTGRYSNENPIVRGIEFDKDTEQRTAYHFYNHNLYSEWVMFDPLTSLRVPAEDIIHVYLQDHPNQFRGIPWTNSIVLSLQDVQELNTNELIASKTATCVALILKNEGTTRGFMQPASPKNYPYDSAGNPVNMIQPNMVAFCGPGQDVQLLEPNRPNLNVCDYMDAQHRSAAVGSFGLKASDVTGDFRNSSFSSERSAENAVYPEVKMLQKWFFASVCRVLWTEMVKAGYLVGWFDGVNAPEVDQNQTYSITEQRILDVKFSGPGQLSINPQDDELASMLAVMNGRSNPVIEAAKVGRDVFENMRTTDRVMEAASKLTNLPQAYKDGVCGVKIQPVMAQGVLPTAEEAEKQAAVNQITQQNQPQQDQNAPKPNQDVKPPKEKTIVSD